MIDLNALLGQVQAAGGNLDALAGVLDAVQRAGGLSADLSTETRSYIEQAADALQSGDMNSAKRAAQALMQTPDGAQLTAQLINLLGR